VVGRTRGGPRACADATSGERGPSRHPARTDDVVRSPCTAPRTPDATASHAARTGAHTADGVTEQLVPQSAASVDEARCGCGGAGHVGLAAATAAVVAPLRSRIVTSRFTAPRQLPASGSREDPPVREAGAPTVCRPHRDLPV
jgi:hypothetical protein